MRNLFIGTKWLIYTVFVPVFSTIYLTKRDPFGANSIASRLPVRGEEATYTPLLLLASLCCHRLPLARPAVCCRRLLRPLAGAQARQLVNGAPGELAMAVDTPALPLHARHHCRALCDTSCLCRHRPAVHSPGGDTRRSHRRLDGHRCRRAGACLAGYLGCCRQPWPPLRRARGRALRTSRAVFARRRIALQRRPDSLARTPGSGTLAELSCRSYSHSYSPNNTLPNLRM